MFRIKLIGKDEYWSASEAGFVPVQKATCYPSISQAFEAMAGCGAAVETDEVDE